MNKTVGIVITAMVLLIVTGIVGVIFTGQIDKFTSGGDNLEDQSCDYQRQQIANSENLGWDDLNPECKTSQSEIKEAATEALEQLNSGN